MTNKLNKISKLHSEAMREVVISANWENKIVFTQLHSEAMREVAQPQLKGKIKKNREVVFK